MQHHSSFTKNRKRLSGERIAWRLFEEVRSRTYARKLLSRDRFSIDGTLIEASASMKSFVRREASDAAPRQTPSDDEGSGSGHNPEVDFRGEQRTNETQGSTTTLTARAPGFTLRRDPQEGSTGMRKDGLDAIDVRILCAVQAHGRLSKNRLAEIVDLSPTPCRARLHRLEAAGYIRGYRADIALDVLGDVTRVVVTVALTHHRKSDFERFEDRIRRTGEVTDCVATGGGMDYVLTVFSAGLADFQRLMDSLLDAEIGIDRYMTYIVTREIKSAPPDLARLVAPSGRR